jgi:hypothetical protein
MLILLKRNSIGTRHMELADGKSKSSGRLQRTRVTKQPRFVLCVTETDGVEKGKVYRVIPDKFAREHKLIRIVDDSKEDYLFPAANFVGVTISKTAQRLLEFPAATARPRRASR